MGRRNNIALDMLPNHFPSQLVIAQEAVHSIMTEAVYIIPLHTSSRLAELSGVAGALDKDGYLLQAQP